MLNNIRSSIIWSAIQNWASRIISLVLFIIVSRLLPSDQIGLFAATTIILGFFGLLAEQGLGEAVVQRKEISGEQLTAVFWINLISSALMALCIWYAAPYIATQIKLPEITPLLRLSAFSLPITACSFGQIAARKRTFSYKTLATTNLAATTISTGIVIALVLGGFGVWALVVQALIVSTLTSGLLWLKPVWKLARKPDFRGSIPLFNYGSIRLTSYLLDFASTRYIDIFILTAHGTSALAIYTIGVKLYQTMMQVLSSTVLDVAHNGFSRLATDRIALTNAYYESITLTATIAVPAFCTVAVVAPTLTTLLFGDTWAESSFVMRWMSAMGAIQVLQFYNGTVYNAIGRPIIGLRFLIAKVIITTGTLSIFGKAGLNNMITAFIICQLITAPASFLLVRKLLGFSLTELWIRIWPMLMASTFLSATTIYIQTFLRDYELPILLQLIMSAGAGIVVYIFTINLILPGKLHSTIILILGKNK